MSDTIEIVRFTVPPERAERLVEGHEAARRAIDAVAPGWAWSRLARFDERTWIEIVAWRTRAAFLRALELSVQQPVALTWFELADDGWTLELGTYVDGDEAAPPPRGALELTTARSGNEADLVAAPDAGSAWSSLIEMDGRVWRDDEWTAGGPSLLRLAVRDEALSAVTPLWTKAARIAHSCDSPGELSRSA